LIHEENATTRRVGFTLWAAMLLAALATPVAAARMKVLICAGDAGMWAQERVPLIRSAVEAASPGLATFVNEQSFNFVEKLEAPGFVDQFDVVVFGDVALGEITPEAQQALVHYVEQGGAIVYVVWGKSGVPFLASRDVVPMPLENVLPYQYPKNDPRPDAKVYRRDDAFFKGLDFAGAPDDAGKPLLLSRKHGRGTVYALRGAFGHRYKRISYAKYEPEPVSWAKWPGLGELWARILKDVGEPAKATAPPSRASRVSLRAEVDATKAIDDVRAGNFSIVGLSQLYVEDGGRGEDLFLELNPTGLLDRRTNEMLSNTSGKFPDKPALIRRFGIKGIIMGGNSYGSYGNWDGARYAKEASAAVEAAKAYPDILEYFQPGNEPPLNDGYFQFHKRFTSLVLQAAPGLQVIGPNKAFNLSGVDETGMEAYIAACGSTTDVLNWHIYGQPPSIVRREALHWSKRAEGKLRTPGPGRIMFTEADIWNTGDSQFNYLMMRALTFLPLKEIVGTFQYCMRPRYEGGTYWFGVLQPEGEFSANYNGYWIWRDLRGKLVETRATATPAPASGNLHVIASRQDEGTKITVLAYYDSGYFDRDAGAMADKAEYQLHVKLPAGKYKATRSEAAWNIRKSVPMDGEFANSAIVAGSLGSCQAVSYTWIRQ
jgi:hypothetical protein